MNKKVKAYLKDLGLNTKLYNGYFKTDTKIVAKVDKTIVSIDLNFKGYRVQNVNDNISEWSRR